MEAKDPKNVLIIDDDDHLRNIMNRMLSLNGHSVLLAESGEKGIELCKEHANDIDYIILDLTFDSSDMTGEDIFNAIHTEWPELKIIISTGYGKTPVTERFLSMGAHDLLPKPFAMADLLAVIS